MNPDKQRTQSPDGMTKNSDGTISDVDFHVRQMGLTSEQEEVQSQLISEHREQLLEAQAREAETVDVEFAIKAYQALLEKFPDSPQTPNRLERIQILSR